MKNRLRKIKLKDLIMRYAQNKNELNKFFLNGKYIWEVDLPSIITIIPVVKDLKPDYKLDNIGICLKTGITPTRDNSYMVSVYELDDPATSKLYINNSTFKQRFSYYEESSNYGKTWWMLNYKYRIELENIIEEATLSKWTELWG